MKSLLVSNFPLTLGDLNPALNTLVPDLSLVCFFVHSFCLFCNVSPERLTIFVTFRGFTLYREKLLLELSHKTANIITRQVNALK